MFKLARIFTNSKIINHGFKKFSTVIKMPSLSPTMSEGGIVEWYKKEGDKITAGDLICDVQTDKAVVGMEAEEDGILAKIIKVKDSQGILVGDAIAVMADSDEDWKSVKIPSSNSEATASQISTAPAVETKQKPVAKQQQQPDNERLGPAVRLLLDKYGLGANQIQHHSGPHDILIKTDVLQHIDKSKLSPITIKSSKQTCPVKIQQQQQHFVDLPLTSMRQLIAKRMTASKSSIPHQYTTGKADIGQLLALRKRLKSQPHAVLLSVNDFIVKAVSLALRLVPSVNNGLSTDGNIIVNRSVDISVAVASENGLTTPIVFDADKLPLPALSSVIHELAEKARNNKLQPQEFNGGTFTISNLGMFGIKQFTAIINYPQSAILAVGAGLLELEFDSNNPSLPKSVTKMSFTLSSDARVVNETAAAEFVSHVKTYLENPIFLLSDEDNLAQAWTY